MYLEILFSLLVVTLPVILLVRDWKHADKSKPTYDKLTQAFLFGTIISGCLACWLVISKNNENKRLNYSVASLSNTLTNVESNQIEERLESADERRKDREEISRLLALLNGADLEKIRNYTDEKIQIVEPDVHMWAEKVARDLSGEKLSVRVKVLEDRRKEEDSANQQKQQTISQEVYASINFGVKYIQLLARSYGKQVNITNTINEFKLPDMLYGVTNSNSDKIEWNVEFPDSGRWRLFINYNLPASIDDPPWLETWFYDSDGKKTGHLWFHVYPRRNEVSLEYQEVGPFALDENRFKETHEYKGYESVIINRFQKVFGLQLTLMKKMEQSGSDHSK